MSKSLDDGLSMLVILLAAAATLAWAYSSYQSVRPNKDKPKEPPK